MRQRPLYIYNRSPFPSFPPLAAHRSAKDPPTTPNDVAVHHRYNTRSQSSGVRVNYHSMFRINAEHRHRLVPLPPQPPVHQPHLPPPSNVPPLPRPNAVAPLAAPENIVPPADPDNVVVAFIPAAPAVDHIPRPAPVFLPPSSPIAHRLRPRVPGQSYCDGPGIRRKLALAPHSKPKNMHGNIDAGGDRGGGLLHEEPMNAVDVPAIGDPVAVDPLLLPGNAHVPGRNAPVPANERAGNMQIGSNAPNSVAFPFMLLLTLLCLFSWYSEAFQSS